MGKLRGKVTKDKSSQSVGMEKPQANLSKKNFSIYPDKICQVIKLINKYFCRAQGKKVARHGTAASFAIGQWWGWRNLVLPCHLV